MVSQPIGRLFSEKHQTGLSLVIVGWTQLIRATTISKIPGQGIGIIDGKGEVGKGNVFGYTGWPESVWFQHYQSRHRLIQNVLVMELAIRWCRVVCYAGFIPGVLYSYFWVFTSPFHLIQSSIPTCWWFLLRHHYSTCLFNKQDLKYRCHSQTKVCCHRWINVYDQASCILQSESCGLSNIWPV